MGPGEPGGCGRGGGDIRRLARARMTRRSFSTEYSSEDFLVEVVEA